MHKKIIAVHGYWECHAEGAIVSKKKGDRRISPLSRQVPIEKLVDSRSEARFFTALRYVQNDIAFFHEQLQRFQVLCWMLLAIAGALPQCCADDAKPKSMPNILWITSEDNGCFLGCYGDPLARTPNIDALAARGIRYTHCYANAPVCAVARSGWITGVPAVTLGTHHMRSKYRIPDSIVPYPMLLRQSGYYTTNQSKTDYNTRSFGKSIWDDCSNNATFKNAPQDQPFFAVFNFTTSHESRIFPKYWDNDQQPQTPASGINVPPYQVSTPEVLLDWRRMYDQNSKMDQQVGQVLKDLEASGRADNTIVVYCSDHGGITLRSKRFLYDSGTHVPLVVAFPPALQHLAPAQPNSVSERLVQFMDMPATWLSLAGVAVPSTLPGKIFLGPETQPAPETVFLFSSRFDESPEMRRGVTDGRWKYIRNYEPDRPRFQMLEYPWHQDGQRSQWQQYAAGKTNELQSAFYHSQPSEELFDTQSDQHEVNNLAADPAHAQRLKLMRAELLKHILAARDCGFIPEPIMAEIDADASTTIYKWAQRPEAYPLEKIVTVANLASDSDPKNLNRLIEFARDSEPIIRYWAMVGLRAIGNDAESALGTIEAGLQDNEVSVRINAAIALGNLGQTERASNLLLTEAKNTNSDTAANWALDGLKYLDVPAAIEGIDKDTIVKGEYSGRIYDLLQAGGSMHHPPHNPMP